MNESKLFEIRKLFQKRVRKFSEHSLTSICQFLTFSATKSPLIDQWTISIREMVNKT